MYQYSKDAPFGDKMLWASVLRRAVFDYVWFKGVGSNALEWTRAYQYVFSPGQRYENGLGFEEVCELFGWDPDYLRRMAVTLTKADIKKMETSQFRDDFLYDEAAALTGMTEKWKTANFAVPFLPVYKYNDEYRKKMTPKRVFHKATSGMHLVQWQVA